MTHTNPTFPRATHGRRFHEDVLRLQSVGMTDDAANCRRVPRYSSAPWGVSRRICGLLRQPPRTPLS